jgi:hypothetical protein
MIEYRAIQTRDVDAVKAFAIEGMRAHLYPGVLDESKVTRVVTCFDMLQDAIGFNYCAFQGGKVVGVIAALVQEREWMERMAAHVVCCRATVPGVGRRLLSALRDWADANIMIRHVSFALECDVDERMVKLLRRYGFARQQIVMHYFKGD